jgi:4-amino-4-deoxy-L-arabinose transferase-like glycosyltransferase
MKIKKINNNKTLIFFLFAHVVVWTLIPSVSNTNLPLDTIEALAWGSNLDWGYSKHPPFSAWMVEIFYQIFGNQDWAYYFLSQLFVITAFFIIFKFSEDFFRNKIFSLISVLLLEGIYFYNFTTPEFNVNVCQLPFWSLTVYYCWKGIKQNDITSWLLLGLFAACGVLSKYLFVYLLVAIDIFFIYLIKKKKFNSKCLISLISFFAILTPHFVWLADSNYATFSYAFKRTGLEQIQFLDHIYNPIIFLGKQFGILIPFFLMFLFAVSKFKPKFNFKDKKFLFLLIINIVPILLMLLTSLLTGTKLRTMWMTPFYLFMGVFFVYIFQKTFILHRLKYFFSIFLILFIFSPATYLYISMTQNDKRTDYPGKKISQTVQEKWENNFSNKIDIVGGNEWHAGNLSYHLKSRPKWDNIFETGKVASPNNNQDGFVLIGEDDILSKICNGVFFKIEGQGICMIGKKK